MQKAVPYRPQLPPAAAASESSGPHALAAGDGHGGKFNGTKVNIQRMVMENPVIVFGRYGCCMCHVVTRLLLGLGVNPTLYEVLEEDEAALVGELSRMVGHNDNNGSNNLQFPTVFVGGRLFGGLDKVMATHISGELVPILREAGALWL
ncbi:glutaredoxin-C9-like [Punica granatum]|uniref:Glutaredoxin-C9-like n=2 Tax=Punica granatum TaxID=22663 RepID=A0A218WXH1_PUNGR|nr:glutaredoxin-C9-like [Punica granatum]OWM77404.1 hypothetical protein CDL15_Pgr016801 [Punica granatum]